VSSGGADHDLGPSGWWWRSCRCGGPRPVSDFAPRRPDRPTTRLMSAKSSSPIHAVRSARKAITHATLERREPRHRHRSCDCQCHVNCCGPTSGDARRARRRSSSRSSGLSGSLHVVRLAASRDEVPALERWPCLIASCGGAPGVYLLTTTSPTLAGCRGRSESRGAKCLEVAGAAATGIPPPPDDQGRDQRPASFTPDPTPV